MGSHQKERKTAFTPGPSDHREELPETELPEPEFPRLPEREASLGADRPRLLLKLCLWPLQAHGLPSCPVLERFARVIEQRAVDVFLYLQDGDR